MQIDGGLRGIFQQQAAKTKAKPTFWKTVRLPLATIRSKRGIPLSDHKSKAGAGPLFSIQCRTESGQERLSFQLMYLLLEALGLSFLLPTTDEMLR